VSLKSVSWYSVDVSNKGRNSNRFEIHDFESVEMERLTALTTGIK
jgi:hypothetical protein